MERCTALARVGRAAVYFCALPLRAFGLERFFMRNDARDELQSMPSLRAEPLFDEPVAGRQSESEPPRATEPATVQSQGKSSAGAALWVVSLALVIALVALGWWSHQQLNLMGQQLVATQERFVQISEEAAGRIQDISGKVVATESSVTSESESLKLRVKQLEGKLVQAERQQQTLIAKLQSLETQQSNQTGRTEKLQTELAAQQAAQTQASEQFKKLTQEQASLRAAQLDKAAVEAQLKSLDGQFKALSADIASVKNNSQQADAIKRLEQDLLILRTQVENRGEGGVSVAEFDAYRAQVTRSLTTLQSQVQNLQQQLNTQ